MNPFKDFESFKQSSNFNSKNYQVGTLEESILLPTLCTVFYDTTLRSLPEGSLFDFQGHNKVIELKSRLCKRNTFKDTAIGASKIAYAKQQHHLKIYFVFQFLDGIYYWEYDPSIKLRSGKIPTTGIPHWFIPVEILIPVI